MKVLVLESSGSWWGVACVACDPERGEARLLSHSVSYAPRELSVNLFTQVQSTLDAADWQLGDLEVLCAGLGPGSWTGLRIALSGAKTLAQTRGIPLAGVPSFDGAAQSVWRTASATLDSSQLLLVTAPCRPGEIYAKIYEVAPDYLAVVQEEWIGSIELVCDTLGTENLARGLEAPTLLCGGAAQTLANMLTARGEEYSVAAPTPEETLLETAIAGAIKVAGGDADDALRLQPLYLAPSNAERNLLTK